MKVWDAFEGVMQSRRGNSGEVKQEAKVGPFGSGSNVDFGSGTHSTKVSWYEFGSDNHVHDGN